MKKIPLTQGQFALVDDVDFRWLSQWKWSARFKRNTCYAFRSSNPGIMMHREILGLTHKDGKITDHIDGNGLNNQRSNLRTCTSQQNNFNQSPRERTSKYKGVYKANNRWRACVMVSYKPYYLGNFGSEVEAARAYDKKAKELHGEFAYLNFPKIKEASHGG